MAPSSGEERASEIQALRGALQQERAKSARLEKDLAEVREQQAAAAEILRVIGSSPDLQSVLNAIAANAARLCDCGDVLICRTEGE
ncbi:MAG TPA: hypothetical protein VLD61_05015, partial [Methylomirabilota bacterium]|nr:hypothetical protein [Methylomirabilota bacterium]